MSTKHANTVKWLLVPLCLCLVFLVLARHAVLKNERERAVLPLVRAAAEEFHVQTALILAVIKVESDFCPDAVSDAGAVGLMQLLPTTFSWLCEQKLCEPHNKDEILIPSVNIRYGTYYLAYLLERFGAPDTALAAYNAGEGRVEEWLSDPTLSQNGKLLTIPFPETAAYVERVLAAREIYLEKYPDQGERS